LQTQTQTICAQPTSTGSFQAVTKSTPIPAAPRPSLIPLLFAKPPDIPLPPPKPSLTTLPPKEITETLKPIATSMTTEQKKPLRPNAKGSPVMTRKMLKDAQPLSGRTRSQSQSYVGRSTSPTRQSREQSYVFQSYNLHEIYDVSIISDPSEPKSIYQALKSDEADQWRASAIQELTNFYTRDSWEIVPRQMAYDMGKNIIGSKWVFKKKVEIDGSIRFKSRIVSKGYMQIPGIDYTERYSPVANDSTT
jgi:hypothetical protein